MLKGNELARPRPSLNGDYFERDLRTQGIDGLSTLQDLGYDASCLAIDQRTCSVRSSECELLKVDAKEMQYGCVKVIVIDDVLHSFVAELVSLTVDVATFHSTAGEPNAEAVRIVIATDVLLVLDDR